MILPLRGCPILLSLLWKHTKWDSTQSYYHYESYDNKIVILTELFEGLKISSATKILCNRCRPRNIVCWPLTEPIFLAYPANFTADVETNLLWLFGVTIWNVRQCEIGNYMRCFLRPCFLRLQNLRSKQGDFPSIEACVLEVIKSRKL